MKEVTSNTFLVPNDLPGMWFGVDYHCVLYRGCQLGCVYCTENKQKSNEKYDGVSAKINITEVLPKELARSPGAMIGFGSMTESYPAEEKELNLTEKALEIILKSNNSIHITTKSDVILRDISLLTEINKKSFSGVAVSIMCDDELSKILEPGVPSSSRRFDVIRQLSSAGIYTGVLLMPILPLVTDTTINLKYIAKRAAEAGAKFVIPYFGVDLSSQIREYYLNFLNKYYYGYDSLYNEMYVNTDFCQIPRYEFFKEMFIDICNDLNLEYNMLKLKHFKYKEK
ncbi:MAG: radical protein [Clostridia bacterium]|nr:radical protein [Clostridia bacterium]